MLLYRFIASFLIVIGVAYAANNDQPPVILISVDTLRADHLGAYGYKRIPTPNLDAFAEHGTIFTSIDSQIPLTLPSHTCLFTSTYPFANGVEENGEIVPATLLTLASVLRQHGYRTGAFIGSDLLAQRFKLDRGFDIYDSPFHPEAGAMQNPYDVRVRRDAALVVRSASQWLAAGGTKPPFLFLHCFDLHAPYLAASNKSSQPNVLGYDAEVQYVDRVLGRFRKMLVDKGWWDRALVILLSDHGESLGEHGETSHGYFVYQSTLWVPLLIHWPVNAQPLPETVHEAGGLIDVTPTILDFLHIEQPSSFLGKSLLKRTNHTVYSESLYAHDAFRWSPLRSLRSADFQYIDAPTAEFYNLKADPLELKNVIQSNAKKAIELRSNLHSLLSAHSKHQPATPEASPETNSTLRSLGYVSNPSRAVIGSGGPDPKSRLPEYQSYERGLEALYSHRELQAVAILGDLVKRDPANTIARYYLGEAYLRLQRRDQALREWKTALAQDPTYTPAAEAIQKLGDTKR
jgi:arylsulfatase A-like enzyme